MRKVLTELADARKAARRLKDLPTGRYPAWFDPQKLNEHDATRMQSDRVAAFVRLDALLSIHDGDHAAIVDAVHASFNVARSVGDEPGLSRHVEYLVYTESAVRILNRAGEIDLD